MLGSCQVSVSHPPFSWSNGFWHYYSWPPLESLLLAAFNSPWGAADLLPLSASGTLAPARGFSGGAPVTLPRAPAGFLDSRCRCRQSQAGDGVLGGADQIAQSRSVGLGGGSLGHLIVGDG